MFDLESWINQVEEAFTQNQEPSTELSGRISFVTSDDKHINGRFSADYDIQRQHPLIVKFYPDEEHPELLTFQHDSVRVSEAQADNVPVKFIGKVIIIGGHASSEQGLEYIDLLPLHGIETGTKDMVDYMIFWLPNLMYLGSNYVRYGRNPFCLGRINFRLLDDIEITVDQVPDYKQKEEQLKKRAGKAITAAAKIERCSNQLIEVEKTIQRMEVFERLLSFATGAVHPFISCVGYCNDKAVYKSIRNISVDNWETTYGMVFVKESLQCFLENTYTSFEELYKEKPKVWTAISKLYSRANRSGLTVETKIYSLVVIWEYLIGLLVDKQFFSDILSEKEEKDLKSKIRSFLKEEVQPLIESQSSDFGGEFKDMLNGKINDLLRRSFKRQIRDILGQYNIEYNNSKLTDFINARNDVIHAKGEMELDALMDGFQIGLVLLEKLLRKLLNYDGPYLDKSQFPYRTRN